MWRDQESEGAGQESKSGIAFITYIEKALKLNELDYESCTLRVNLSGKEALQVFVGGLPIELDEATLKQHFGECGKIAAFLLPSSARNCLKGIAYITYFTQEGGDKALVFHGTDYAGRTLQVNKADAE